VLLWERAQLLESGTTLCAAVIWGTKAGSLDSLARNLLSSSLLACITLANAHVPALWKLVLHCFT